MADEDKFISRWSRLKREAREQAENPAPPKPESPADPKAPAPDLPPPDKLDFDSDYRGFFHPKVDEDTRRAGLKKLFSDARFNVIDDMDIDIEDYSKYAPLSATVVASLKQTQNILQWARERKEEEQRREAEQARLAEGPAQAEPGESEPDALAQPAAAPEVADSEPSGEHTAASKGADARKA